MTAKEYLNQVQLLEIIIENKQKEISDLRLDIANLSSALASGERVQSSATANARYVSALEKIEKLENEIIQYVERKVSKRNLIINQINSLESKEYIEILYKRYIEYKKLEQIAVEMNYDYAYIRHLHGYALEDFKRRHTITHLSLL